MFKNKYNLIILILGLVFVLGGCLKKVENKPVVEKNQVVKVEKKEEGKVGEKTEEVKKSEVDTSDWLICRNEELNFKMKYPKEWKIVEEKIDGELKNFLTLNFDTGYKIIKNQKPLIIEIKSSKFSDPNLGDFYFIEETEFKYNLANGAKASFEASSAYDWWDVKFINNSSYYSFNFDLNIPSGIGDDPEPMSLYINEDTIPKITKTFRLMIKSLEQIK